MALSALRRELCAAKRTCGLSACTRSAAVSALRRPMSGVVWMIWRCRLDSDTSSSSTTPSSPMPAAARYITAGADDKHRCLLERLLAGPTDLMQHDVPRITFELVAAQHRLSKSPFVTSSS